MIHRLRWSLRESDARLSVLLFLQCLIVFVLVPLTAANIAGRWLMDIGLLVYILVCALGFADRRSLQVAMLVCTLPAIMGPFVWRVLTGDIGVSRVASHEALSLAAFFSNALVTVMVARHAFGAGQVTRHRILGAVFVYLNVAILFSIMYDMLDILVAGAISHAAGGAVGGPPGQRSAELAYFSLSTITTCGYGDLVPVNPVARSLANLEAVFGQLYPATFVARLVALHLAHNEGLGKADQPPGKSD
jgi:hypothetical protein